MTEGEVSLSLQNPAPTYGDEPGEGGDLLTMDAKQAAEKAMKMWQAQKEIMKPILEQIKVNEWMRRGIVGARMIQDPSSGQWRARPPSKTTISAEFINKAATLCRKFTGVLTADPPAPDAVPGEGSGDDPSSSEFTTRALIAVEKEMGRVKKLTRAIDLSHTSGTAFEHFYYDPTAAGRVPIEIQAGYDPTSGEQATSVEDAEFRTFLDMAGQPVRQAWPKFKSMYVTPQGTLTERKAEAATRWEGCIRSEVVRTGNVRLYPHHVDDVDEAHGAGILTFVPWGAIKKQFPQQIEALAEETIDGLFSWTHDWTEAALPPGVDKNWLSRIRGEGDDSKEEWLVPVLATYFDGRKCPSEYPQGLYILQLGDSVILHRGTWEYTDQEGVTQNRSIPLSQLTLFREGRHHWSGVALMEILGPANEIRAAQIGSLLDYLDRVGSVKTFVPTDSIIDSAEMTDRSKRVIRYNPLGGKPEVENLPPYPQGAAQMFEAMTLEMRDDSGLQEAGSGMEAPSIESGVQAMAVISQIQATLSPQARAVIDCYLRGCRIELEIIKAHYTKPRQIAYVGEDGRFKQQAWDRSDIAGATDVQLANGSMTMLRPAQKALLAREYFEMGVLPPDEFKLATEKNIGGTLAMQDNHYRQRIRRQIEDWKQGPPEGWVAPEMIGMDPMTGQPIYADDPYAMGIWDSVPSDILPSVAETRLSELARLTASVAYQERPEGWRRAVEQEFARMLGVVTMQIQQGAQQQQAQVKARKDGVNPSPSRSGQSGTRRTAGAGQDQGNTSDNVMSMQTAIG